MVMLLFLALLYAGLLLYYATGWRKSGSEPASAFPQHLPSVTILIPARNEAPNLPALLNFLKSQHYHPIEPVQSGGYSPLHRRGAGGKVEYARSEVLPSRGEVETILINDHSTDDTSAIATVAGVRAISLPEGCTGKKAALTAGISEAKGDIIVNTDADCTMGPHWLQHLVAPFALEEVQMVAGPVVMENGRGFLAAFQAIDMLGMQCLTGGAIARRQALLCNGANLAYRKEAFEQVKGFEGISSQASGDDVLLMHKMLHKWPGTLRFSNSPEAVVATKFEQSLGKLWHQRLRWVSKTSKMRTPETALLMGTAWLLHVALLLGMAVAWWMPELAWIPAAAFLLKVIPEWWCVHLAARQLRVPLPALWLLPAQLVYIPYVAVVGFLGNFVRYRWKGRSLR